jgi:SAM-dependent methyltransferase
MTQVATLSGEKLKVDLGCGFNKREGFIGVDIASGEGIDITHDLNVYPYPFDDGSVAEIYTSHFVEHVGSLMAFMDECYRILEPGGKMLVIAPYYTSIRCWQDPTHLRAISEASFLYYNAEWRRVNKLEHYPIRCDFDFTYGYQINPNWQGRSQQALDFAVRHYYNVVDDIHVTLTKRIL